MKFEYFVVYENISDNFYNGHYQIKVNWDLEIFLHLPKYKLSGHITHTLVAAIKLILSKYVLLKIIHNSLVTLE